MVGDRAARCRLCFARAIGQADLNSQRVTQRADIVNPQHMNAPLGEPERNRKSGGQPVRVIVLDQLTEEALSRMPNEQRGAQLQ